MNSSSGSQEGLAALLDLSLLKFQDKDKLVEAFGKYKESVSASTGTARAAVSAGAMPGNGYHAVQEFVGCAHGTECDVVLCMLITHVMA